MKKLLYLILLSFPLFANANNNISLDSKKNKADNKANLDYVNNLHYQEQQNLKINKKYQKQINNATELKRQEKIRRNTDQYKSYTSYAKELKKGTNQRIKFNKNDISNNTTDINTLLESSTPNWKNLNTSIQSIYSNDKNNQNHSSIPLIFISFSMPEELIKEYITEAKQYNGVLVLKGLINNSLKQTVVKLKQIEGISDTDGNNNKSNLSIIIHPHLFKLYNVKQVPAVVVSKNNADCVLKYDDCSALYEFDKMYGSVTIEYALEEVQRNGSSSIKPIAEITLNNKKGI